MKSELNLDFLAKKFIAEAMNNTSKTDWARIDAMTDHDIDTSDIAPLTEDFFCKIWLLPYRFMQKLKRG